MANTDKISLYNNLDSSPTWRVRIVLALKEIKYERINFSFDVPVEEKYVKLNPLGQIPTLMINNEALTQSMAIVSYLEEKYPTPSLLPDDLMERARARQIAEIVNTAMQPLHNYFWSQNKDNELEYFRLSKVYVEKGLHSIEAILKKTSGKFCIGDKITIADVFLCPELYRAIEYGVKLSEFPKCEMMWESLMKIEAFFNTGASEEPGNKVE